MTIEAILASLHLLAILTFVVFLSSQAALCRSEWMSAAVVQRLARLDLIYGVAVVFLVLTGIARLVWGVKGTVSSEDDLVRRRRTAVHQAHAGVSPLAAGTGGRPGPAFGR